MPNETQARDFSRLFELIRQGDLADRAAATRHHVSAVDSGDAAAFLARAARSLERAG